MRKKLRIWIYAVAVIGTFLMFTSGCEKSDDDTNNPSSGGTVKDIDGNIYHTVTIGTQVWMVENLKTTKYRNGDAIPLVADDTWPSLTTGAYCNYDEDPSLGNKYGKLYNGYALKDSRKIAPAGWHIPTPVEWNTLNNYLKANLGTSGSVSKALAAKTDWASSSIAGCPGNDLTKNNSSGFNALPSGYLGKHYGGDPRVTVKEYHSIGYATGWWLESEGEYGVLWELNYNYEYLRDIYYYEDFWFGYPIRCIKD